MTLTTHSPVLVLSETSYFNGGSTRHRKGLLATVLYLLAILGFGVAATINGDVAVPAEVERLAPLNETGTADAPVYQSNCTFSELLADENGECLSIDPSSGIQIVTRDAHALQAVVLEGPNQVTKVQYHSGSANLEKRWNMGNAPLGTWFHHWYTRYGHHYWTDWKVQSCAQKFACGVGYHQTITRTDKLTVKTSGSFNLAAGKAFGASIGVEVDKERTYAREVYISADGCNGYQLWGKEHWCYQRQNVRWMVKRCYGGGSCLHSGDGEGFDHDVDFPVKDEVNYWMRNEQDYIDYNQCGVQAIKWL